MNTWNQTNSHSGQMASAEELRAAEPTGEPQQERETSGKQDDGRGDAVLDGAPKPQPGDELYDTIHQGRSEAIERADAARQQQGGYSATEYAAVIAMTAPSQQPEQDAGRSSEPSQQVQEQPNQQQPQEIAGQDGSDQRGPQGGRGTLYALRAQQAAADLGPQPGAEQQEPEPEPDLIRDFVTPDTTATVEAERGQMQQQRNRTMGLGM